MPTEPTPFPIDQRFYALIDGMGDVGSVDDGELRDRLVELEHVVNMAQAAQAQFMSEMAHRAGVAEYEFVGDEIAITLSTTKPAASNRLGLALGATTHPVVMTAWQQGVVDSRKVQVICDGLADASPLTIETLVEGAAAYAATHTAPELRRWMQRRVIQGDPEAAEAQRQRAEARKITVTPLGNGLSELVALLPSVQARQIYDTVNAVAQSASHDDSRTMDQRRSDAFVDLVVGRAEPPQVTMNVVVPVDTMLSGGAAPATLAGVGPITATQARRLAADRLFAFSPPTR